MLLLFSPWSGGWAPIRSTGISDDGSRVFTTTAGDSWDKGAHSGLTYAGDHEVRCPSDADYHVFGLSPNPVSNTFYDFGVGGVYCSVVSNQMTPFDRFGPATGASATGVMTPGVSYFFVRRLGANIEFGYSADGTGTDEVVHHTMADGTSGAPLYVVAAAYTGGATFGPVTRTELVSPVTAIAGASSVAFSASASLAGKGVLTGASAPAFTGSGTLLGKGVLTGASSPAFSLSGSIVGKGSLTGTSSPAFSASGALLGFGGLSGSTTVTFALSGAVTGLGGLSGASSAAFSANGSLTGLGSLSGSTSPVFVLAGTLGDAPNITFIDGVLSFGFTVAGTLSEAPRVRRAGLYRPVSSRRVSRLGQSTRSNRSSASRRR